MKYLFIELNIQDGENRHTHRVLHTTNGTDIDFVSQLYASRYYGSKSERYDSWWNFQAGCIGVKVVHVRELTEYEYNLLSEIFSYTGKRKDYFEIVHSGYQKGIDREEIQVHAGENGNIFISKNPMGFVVDVFGQNNNPDTMHIFESMLTDDEQDNTDISDYDIKQFKEDWGQKHSEITAELGYSIRHNESDELLMEDYFWVETDKKWYNKHASMFTEKEQRIANHLQNK